MELINERKFKAYEELRRLGKCNMFNTACVKKYTRLDRREILNIMENYQKYYEKWY